MKDCQIQAREIQRQVAAELGLKREKLVFGGHQRDLVNGRKTAMLRCRLELGMGYAAIGEAFKMHHTTVIHHIGKVSGSNLARREYDSMLATIRRQAKIIREQAQQIATLAGIVESWNPAESSGDAI